MFYLALSKIASQIVSFIGLIFVVSVLDVAEFGVYTTLLFATPFVLQVLTLCNYEYFLNRAPLVDESDQLYQLFWGVFILPLLLVILCGVGAILFLGMPVIYLAYMLGVLTFDYINRFYVALNSRYLLAVADFLTNAAWFLMIMLLVLLFDVAVTVEAILISRVTCIGLLVIIFLSARLQLLHPKWFCWLNLVSSIKFGLPVLGGGLCYSALIAIDRVFLGWRESSESAGLYSFIMAPFTIVLALFIGTIFIGNIRKIRRLDVDNSKVFIQNLSITIVKLFAPIFVFIATFFNVYEAWLGQGKYIVQAWFPMCAAFSVMLFLLLVLGRQIVIVSGMGGHLTFVYIPLLLLYATLAWFLYPLYGVSAAIVLNFLVNMSLFVVIWRLLELPLFFLAFQIAAATTLSIVISNFLYLLLGILVSNTHSYPYFFLSVVFCALGIVVIYILFFFSNKSRLTLKEALV